MLLLFLLGVALTNTFGRTVDDQRHGWALFAAMAVMFTAGPAMVYASEGTHNAALLPFGIDQAAGSWRAGSNMEGGEARFGIGHSARFATVTTASSDGAVNPCMTASCRSPTWC
jgi:potassium-transporting ATPase potassium-binding subunit